ncbi:MAG: choice-of-anchor Q domain-containing protein, partial [Chitinophagaceae bacterium]
NAAGGGYGGGIANINSAPAIAGCSFKDNIANQGGGMYNSRTSTAGIGTAISYCTFSGNSATGSVISNGGGLNDISNNATPSTISYCTFSGNTSTGYGGGLYGDNSFSTAISASYLHSCVFNGNTAAYIGGGVRNNAYNFSYKIDSCTFNGNRAGDLGGGMFATCTGTITVAPVIAYCTFSADTAISGGGLHCGYGRTDANNCSFTQNMANSGGGLYTESSWNCDFWNNVFSGNTATLRGAGMYTAYAGSGTRISGCLFSGNAAGIGGGGLCDSTSNPSVINCTFAGNAAPTGVGIYNIVYAAPAITNSIIWDGANSITDSSSTDTVSYSIVQGGYSGSTNLSTNPGFVIPVSSTLAPTVTGNYRLSSGSPAIDAGNGSPFIDSTDLTGNARVYGTKVDMGAYESQCFLPAITGKDSLCLFTTTLLSNTTSGGTWSSSNPTIATISTTGLVTGVTAGTDTITYSVTSPCTTSITKIITVNALPAVATTTGSGALCMGSSITLSNAVTGGAWTSSNSSVATVNSSGVVSGVSAAGVDTISYTVTNSFGCINSASRSVTVNAVPAAPTITSPVTYCQNATAIQLSATGSSLGWYTTATGGTLSSAAPTPVTTSAGTTGYWVSQTNSAGCESPRAQITVNVLPTPAKPTISGTTPVCAGDTLHLFASTSATHPVFNWTGTGFSSALQNPVIANTTASAAGVYLLSVTDSGCVSATDTLVVVVSCLDSVWPGDANYDKTVDNTDALEIALTMGSTGSARSSASILWQPVYCRDWASQLLGNPTANRKHADCDGNGTVGFSDTLAVTANYGLTYPKGIHTAAKKTAGLPDLYFDLSGIIPMAGNTISIPIKLGTSTTPISKMAGIAARIMIADVTPANIPALSYGGSWLGGTGSTLHFAKAISNGRLDWAYARTDHGNTAGFGTLAVLTLTLPAGSQGQQMRLYFDEVSLVDSNGEKITQVNIVDDTLTILKDNTGISGNTTGLPMLLVLPNPSSAACTAQLTLPVAGNYSLELRDLSGKLIWQSSGNAKAGLQSISLPTDALSAGVYLVSLHSEGRVAMPVRWIKE